MAIEWVEPDWPAPGNVRAVFTTRIGGTSAGVYESLNLAQHVGDDAEYVAKNRRRLGLPGSPLYLNQIHGNRCVDADGVTDSLDADGSVTRNPGCVLAILVADCVPVLLTSRQGNVVGVAHAGWRGLAQKVISQTVNLMASQAVIAWLGPAIGPCHYEVGDGVRNAFASDIGFALNEPGRWQMNLYAIARAELESLGVAVFGGDFCTFCDDARFFSYRRDCVTGRMGGFIWFGSEPGAR